MDKQVLVVGWDGATESHLAEYDLEWYGGLDHGGVLLPEPFWQSREIDSGSAWTTLTTGLSTEEHGVAMLSGLIEDERQFDLFSSVDRLIPRNLFGRPARIWARRQVLGRQPTNDDVPYKRVWHYVPDSLAFAVPLTYPPKETDGVTVSGFPSPAVSVQPESLEEWVRERYDGEPSKFDDAGEIRDGYVEDLFRTHEAERDLVLELVDRREFRLHFVVFTLLDRLLHVTDDAEVIERAYRTMDETTARLVDAHRPGRRARGQRSRDETRPSREVDPRPRRNDGHLGRDAALGRRDAPRRDPGARRVLRPLSGRSDVHGPGDRRGASADDVPVARSGVPVSRPLDESVAVSAACRSLAGAREHPSRIY